MKNDKKIIVIISITVITILIASTYLLFHRANELSSSCVFDILTPDEFVEIFFEVKDTVLNNPEAEIFPLLSSTAKNFLRVEGTDPNDIILIRGEFFRFVNTEASILYLPGYSTNSGEPVTRVVIHIPPCQEYDINQWHK